MGEVLPNPKSAVRSFLQNNAKIENKKWAARGKERWGNEHAKTNLIGAHQQTNATGDTEKTINEAGSTVNSMVNTPEEDIGGVAQLRNERSRKPESLSFCKATAAAGFRTKWIIRGALSPSYET